MIIIRLDANHQKGMGHLFRMMVLSAELSKAGFKCRFAVRSNSVTETILEEKKIPYFSFSPDVLETDIIESIFSRYRVIDAWLYDLLDTAPEWIEKIQFTDTPVMCIDDLKGGPQKANLVINPICGCWENVRRRFKWKPNVLNGPEYAILNPELAELHPIEYDSGPFKIGISMGGSDTHGASVAIASVLSPLDCPDLEFHFFLGPHFAHFQEIQTVLRDCSAAYKIHRAVPDLLKELIKAHLVICGGGQTLFELLSLGMPVLALANEFHEERTIDYFTRKKTCINLGSIHGKIGTDILVDTVLNAETIYPSLLSMGKKGSLHVGHNGAAKCLKALLTMIGKNTSKAFGIK
ncbi:hypothetical protein [Desulfobacter sp.]|uniref:PseG/SpsG family protein n=1 Tax=Desulfobacter sp. TaxID=2294 RepID=UPI000E820FBC|nr:hypothetical protein [Desulfobacter sp.]HBT87881.1 hypothetical protein [Desulfobacter sp.]